MEAEEEMAVADAREGPAGETVPAMFRHRAAVRREAVALREKALGVWRSVSWRDFEERARLAGLGLAALGLEPGDRVCVLSRNNPEWLYVDLGTLGIGGVCAGIYPTDAPQQVAYIVNHCAAKFLFVEDDEQLDKALAVRADMPCLRKIVVFDMRHLHDFADEAVIGMDALLELGRSAERRDVDLWHARTADVAADDLAILVYTSGTTGPPKGAMLSHRNIVQQCEGLRTLLPVSSDDERLSFLPLCHAAERILAYACIRHGVTTNFAESMDTVPENLRELQPTVMMAVPRVWERFHSQITLAVRDATPLQRWAYGVAVGLGLRVADHRTGTRPASAALRLADRLCRRLVLTNVRRMMGLDRCRWLLTGAAPIAPDLVRWYLALGLPMLEAYGQTECTGVATLMPPDGIRPGSVGKAVPHVEVALSTDGEILLRSGVVFMGYWNDPETTADTVIDGWLHTGDVGRIDADGYVTITDRMKDIIITAGGKNVTPSEIESQLKFSPYISDAVVIGDKRKFLSCLIMVDRENVTRFAQDNAVPFTDFASLTRARAVVDLIESEIDAVNAGFARAETIKQFRLIERELDPEDEELTPTMKLKRRFVSRKYAALIDDMYRAA